jgi:putative transposase
VAVLKQAQAGTPVAELIRHVGISEQTFYRWKKQYAGLQTDQVRQLKLLQEENARLKKLVAELTLDKAMLSDVLQKSGEALSEAAGGGPFESDYQVSERRACGLVQQARSVYHYCSRRDPRQCTAGAGAARNSICK